MYLRKIDGPRSVKLPDGSRLTRADLPKPETRRWVASRKAIVVKAVAFGLLTREDALETYMLSDDELSEWENAVTTLAKVVKYFFRGRVLLTIVTLG